MDLRVNRGGADVAVTQQLLDVPEVRPSLKKMGRTGVAESVWKRPPGPPGMTGDVGMSCGCGS